MKTIKQITPQTPEGKPMVDAATQKELNTASLIEICLGQSKYASMAEQWQAYEVVKRLQIYASESEVPEESRAELKKGDVWHNGTRERLYDDITLEDAEYEIVKKKVEEFDPYRSGFTFMPFLELFK